MMRGYHRRGRLGLAGLVTIVCVVSGGAMAASASAATSPHVSLANVYVGPNGWTVGLNGSGFGKHPPTSYSAANTQCGPFADNGSWFGNKLWFYDSTNPWQAGFGNGVAAKSNCIGLKVVVWSTHFIGFDFGDALGTNGWTLSSGDHYVVDIKGYYWGAVVP